MYTYIIKQELKRREILRQHKKILDLTNLSDEELKRLLNPTTKTKEGK